jgi:hypothetical protein
MSDIFYPVAHRTDAEIAALKNRYESFDASIIPDVFREHRFTAVSWIKPTSWGTSHVVFIVTVKELAIPLILRANIGYGSPEIYMLVEKLLTDKVSSLGIPVNKILGVDISRKKFAFDFQIQEQLVGKDVEDHFDGSQESYDALSFQLGSYIAQWGRLSFEGFGRFDETLKGTKRSMYDYIIVQLDADIQFLVTAGIVSMSQGGALRKIFDTYKDVMSVATSTLVHYDLADHNIMLDGNQTITGIFDWEAAVTGDPMLDLASAPTWKTHFPRDQKLIEGYQSVRRLPDLYEEKINIYRLRTMIWKMVYAIRAGIINSDRKNKFDAAVSPFRLF